MSGERRRGHADGRDAQRAAGRPLGREREDRRHRRRLEADILEAFDARPVRHVGERDHARVDDLPFDEDAARSADAVSAAAGRGVDAERPAHDVEEAGGLCLLDEVARSVAQ